MYKETTARSIIKTVTWRFWATTITIVLVWLFTHKMELAFSVGGLELTSKLAAYFIHERIWDKINLGRHEVNALNVKPSIINIEEQLSTADIE